MYKDAEETNNLGETSKDFELKWTEIINANEAKWEATGKSDELEHRLKSKNKRWFVIQGHIMEMKKLMEGGTTNEGEPKWLSEGRNERLIPDRQTQITRLKEERRKLEVEISKLSEALKENRPKNKT